MTLKTFLNLVHKFLIIITAVALLPNSAPCSDWYVSSTGNDSAPGTLAQPFRSLTRGVRDLHPGDTLYVRAGNYNETIDSNIPSGTSWAAPVTIKGYAGERPVLNPIGQNVPVLRLDTAPNQLAYIIVDGLVLDGLHSVDPDIPVVRIAANAHHIRISNCEIKNSQNDHGIMLSGSGSTIAADIAGGYNEIINNDIHHNGYVAIGTANHGIYLHTDHNLIQGNTIHHNSSWCVHGFSGSVSYNTVRDNILHDCNSGVLISTGSKNKVYNNVIYDQAGLGILVGGSDNVSNTSISFNTIVNTGLGIRIGADSGDSVSDTDVSNNLVTDRPVEGGITIATTATRTTVRNNLVYNMADQYGCGLVCNQGVSSTIINNLTGNQYVPKFSNSAAKDFHLTAASPAIDAGIDVGTPVDANGDLRPRGSRVDIGAYEFNGNADNPGAPSNLRLEQ